MNIARFTINTIPSAVGGYDATNAEVLTLTLEASADVVAQRVNYGVFDPGDVNSPLASKDAPLLVLDNGAGSTGRNVQADTPNGNVTVTMPASGAHSYIVRCTVNGGVNILGRADPDYVFERLVCVRSGDGLRKVVYSEATQYSQRGPADAQNEFVDAFASGGGSAAVPPDGPFVTWEAHPVLTEAKVITGSTRVSATPGVGTMTLDLATVAGLTAGSYPCPSNVSIDAYGRVTSASRSTAISFTSTGDRTIAIAENYSGAGRTLFIYAGAGYGGAGGNLRLSPGFSGTGGDPGYLSLEVLSVPRFKVDKNGLGFYDITPVARQTVSYGEWESPGVKAAITALGNTGLIVASEVPGLNPPSDWAVVTGFSTTPASASTITMTRDHTSWIRPGDALRWRGSVPALRNNQEPVS